MKKAKMLQALKALHSRLVQGDFSSLEEDHALAKVIQKMESKQEGKYTVVFVYPEELPDGKLQTCVEFVRADSVDEAILRSKGSTVIAVFEGYRQCLYSEA